MEMSTEKPVAENKFSPQYFIINKSEPQYELIKNHLLNASHPLGSSHYFIRADTDNGCICRIHAGNGTVLFYEILNHQREGISNEDIRKAVIQSSNASELPDYFFITPEIEEKLRAVHTPEQAECRDHCLQKSPA
jgi:hypothetical protein